MLKGKTGKMSRDTVLLYASVIWCLFLASAFMFLVFA